MLKDEIDISRGDLLVDAGESLQAAQGALVDVVWMAEQPLAPGQSYDIKIAGKKTRARVDGIRYQVDINNLTQRARQTPAAAERHWSGRSDLRRTAGAGSVSAATRSRAGLSLSIA